MVDIGYWKKFRQYERGECQKLYFEVMINVLFEDVEFGGDGWVNQILDVLEWIECYLEFKFGLCNKIFCWLDNCMLILFNVVVDCKKDMVDGGYVVIVLMKQEVDMNDCI